MFDLLTSARAIASRRYDESYGWSVYTECFDDSDYLRDFSECKDAATLEAAMSEHAEWRTETYEERKYGY